MRSYEKSKKAYAEALELMPGGVNSPVRAFRSVKMDPVFMESGKGSKIRDIDGNEYIDYVLSWGPLMIGHTNEKVIAAITETAAKGTSFGAPSEIESEMAKLVMERMPSIEVIRMVSSGTEATMSAIRLARGFTKRDLIVKFEGCYHGHGDPFLIKAGSGVATLGLPDSPGVPESVAKSTLTIPYNDIEAVKDLFAKYPGQIAAVIVEPVVGNSGCIPPLPGFLEGIREITENDGSLFIFDEVMTGFRSGYYSAQGVYNIKPDLTTMGKIIGGGLPVGAFGGRRDIMNMIAPAGPIYQAGTLSGNPLSMAAGMATLNQLTKEDYVRIEGLTARLEEGILGAAKELNIPMTCNRVGAMIGFFFTDEKVINYEVAKRANTDRFADFYKAMMENGVFLPPSAFETWFLSAVHTDEDIEATIEAARKSLATLV